MAYFTRSDIDAEILPADVIQMLDDDNDGTEDTGLFTSLASRAESRVNAVLARRYDVPFADGSVPLAVAEAAILSLCASLYRRRGVKETENPFAEREKESMQYLKDAASGKVDLDLDLDAVGVVGSIEGEDDAAIDDLHFALGNQEGI